MFPFFPLESRKMWIPSWFPLLSPHPGGNGLEKAGGWSRAWVRVRFGDVLLSLFLHLEARIVEVWKRALGVSETQQSCGVAAAALTLHRLGGMEEEEEKVGAGTRSRPLLSVCGSRGMEPAVPAPPAPPRPAASPGAFWGTAGTEGQEQSGSGTLLPAALVTAGSIELLDSAGEG